MYIFNEYNMSQHVLTEIVCDNLLKNSKNTLCVTGLFFIYNIQHFGLSRSSSIADKAFIYMNLEILIKIKNLFDSCLYIFSHNHK